MDLLSICCAAKKYSVAFLYNYSRSSLAENRLH